MANEAEILKAMLMYFILPLWLIGGVADWLCHRASNIATTSGPKESVLHLMQLFEMGVPILALMFLEVNAGLIALMIACFVLHEATAWWDVAYAHGTRDITPVEQHVHSFLEMLPLMGLLIVVVLHWQQFLALFGLSSEAARFEIALKADPLPALYVIVALTCVVLFEIVPFCEELVRGLRAQRRGAK